MISHRMVTAATHAAVSSISIMNVEVSLAMSSEAPTRENSMSAGVKAMDVAGTYDPICTTRQEGRGEGASQLRIADISLDGCCLGSDSRDRVREGEVGCNT